VGDAYSFPLTWTAIGSPGNNSHVVANDRDEATVKPPFPTMEDMDGISPKPLPKKIFTNMYVMRGHS
jgi:hypothetical protein